MITRFFPETQQQERPLQSLNEENPFILIGVTAVSTEIILLRGEPLASKPVLLLPHTAAGQQGFSHGVPESCMSKDNIPASRPTLKRGPTILPRQKRAQVGIDNLDVSVLLGRAARDAQVDAPHVHCLLVPERP